MDAQDQAAIVQLCVSLGLIGFAFDYMYRRTRVDRYRETLFTLRDDLFDYMWKNDLSFDLPAYRLMRTFLNGAIRVAGEASPLAFVVLMFTISRQMPGGPAYRLPAEIAAIKDARTREYFMRTRDEVVRALLVFLGVIGLLLRLAYKLDRFRAWAREHANRWIDELLLFGSQDARVPLRHSSRLVLRR